MFETLAEVEDHYEALEARLGDPEIAADPRRYAEVAKEHADLRDLVAVYREYRELGRSIASNRELLDDEDPEMREMARAELAELETASEALEHRLKLLLLPKDQFEGRDVLLEIRAGAGGDEAGLFAGNLFRMYTKYVEQNRWKMELLSGNPTGIGGFKEVIVSISGATAYSRLKYESGVHRVQRVPATESQGRIHTSTCTVAIMPEAEEARA